MKLEGKQYGERFILWLYHLMADFGESYKKLFYWILSSICVTAWCMQILEKKSLFVKGLDFHYFKIVFFGIIPLATQKTVIDEIKGLIFWSKFLLTLEGLIVITLSTLFVMAIRRRFRR